MNQSVKNQFIVIKTITFYPHLILSYKTIYHYIITSVDSPYQ
jgi:hypothetical protein